MNTIKFYLEKDYHEEVDYNQETFTFTLQLTKIGTIKRAFENLKLRVIALVRNTTLVQKTLLLR